MLGDLTVSLLVCTFFLQRLKTKRKMANKTAGSQVLELSPSQSVKQIFNEYL